MKVGEHTHAHTHMHYFPFRTVDKVNLGGDTAPDIREHGREVGLRILEHLMHPLQWI